MNTPSPNAAVWAGLDWGDTQHAACLIDDTGSVLDRFTVPHTFEGLDTLIQKLLAIGKLTGVAVERPDGLVIWKLLEAELTVFPVNPMVAKKWRDCEKPAPSKTDPIDAFVLADGLRHHYKKLRPLRLDEAKTRELTLLCSDECALIAERTALVNRLEAILKAYHPVAFAWFSDWTSPSAWDFVLQFSTPERLSGASRKKLTGFLKIHSIALTPLWEQRLASCQDAARWPNDPATCAAKALLAVTLAKQLRTLQAALDVYRARIQELFDEHPDHDIFSSLPGAGPKLRPRLLTLFGSERDIFESAQAVQENSGVVPITYRSGAIRYEKMRHACDKEARQTMFQFAQCSLRRSEWAKAYYKYAREKLGQSHARAIRNLGAKWIKIIYHLWQTNETYDETIYIASLIKHRSPLVSFIPSLNRC